MPLIFAQSPVIHNVDIFYRKVSRPLCQTFKNRLIRLQFEGLCLFVIHVAWVVQINTQHQDLIICDVLSPSHRFLCLVHFFPSQFRARRTQTTWGLLAGKCRSPTNCRRSFILKLKTRTAASTCWVPFKAWLSAQQCSQGGNTERRLLLHQQVGTLVKSCEQYVVTGTWSTLPPACGVGGKQQRKQTHLSPSLKLKLLFFFFYLTSAFSRSVRSGLLLLWNHLIQTPSYCCHLCNNNNM